MKEIISRLQWHAGLLDIPTSTAPSISSCTWLPSGQFQDILVALDDVLGILDLLNIELNGVLPSAVGEKAPDIQRTVVYSINEMLRMLREAQRESASEDVRRLFESTENRLWIAWNAVVAGDIDDIKSHVQEENDLD